MLRDAFHRRIFRRAYCRPRLLAAVPKLSNKLRKRVEEADRHESSGTLVWLTDSLVCYRWTVRVGALPEGFTLLDVRCNLAQKYRGGNVVHVGRGQARSVIAG
jgi:hypothetical protein